MFSKGDGVDDIYNYDTDNSVDLVKFSDLASSGVTAIFQQFNTSDLILQYAGGQLTLTNYFSSDTNYRVNQFQFTNTTWDLASIAQSHNGTAYSETLYAFDGMANTLNGLEGDDYLYGGDSKDTLNGGIGNDNVQGNSGSDILNGGTDNDYLRGDSGADTYLFSKGDGLDEIYNYDTDNSVDIIKFTNLVSTEVIAVFQQLNTDKLILQYAGGQLTVDGYFSSDANYLVDKFQFTDTTWELANIALLHNGTAYGETLSAFGNMANTLNGLAGDDGLYGGNRADTLNGGAGNDSLHGDIGNDVLTGGTGNDILQGDNGSDTYVFSKGDGLDVIYNYDNDGKQDFVQFTDVTSTEVLAVFQQFNTSDLILQYAGGQLTLTSYFSGDANYRINQFQFTDNTLWNLASIAQQHNGTTYGETLYAFDGMANTLNGLAGQDQLQGGTGADNLNGGSGYDGLSGGNGADTLTGGTGNDTLQGDSGADTYVFSQTDGKDVINNYDTDASVDVVKFTDLASFGISAISAVNSYHLLIQYGSNSALTVDYYFYSDTNYRVNQFQFADGITVSNFLVGTTGKDNLTGGTGNDVLSGLSGADKLTGGSGSDLYFVDNIGDVVVEGTGAAGDVDTVKSAISHTLSNNVENLILTGTAAINGTGNTLSNQLTGNDSANMLDGGAGADMLKGGLGVDTFILGTVTGGADAILDFVSATDRLQVADAPLALNIGNGNHIIDNGVKATSGAFSNAAELVIISSTIAGLIDTSSAAAVIGSATAAYGLGDNRLFTVSNGNDSALFLFQSANTNAQVDVAELTLVGTLQGTAQTALTDYVFA